MQLITHEHPSWAERKRFENGAATYSRDIVASQQRHFERSLGDRSIIISTCPLLSTIPTRTLAYNDPELIIQYMHTFPYENPVQYVKKVIARSAYKDESKWLFVVAYRAYSDLLNANGLKSSFVPMMIDTSILPPAVNDIDRAIWFGNIYSTKQEMFDEIRANFKRAGIKLSVITKGMLNSKHPVTQQEAWELISRYRYGVGVGRCALEMFSMGLKVLVAGAEFGGLVMNEDHHRAQEATNYNGRIITWNRSIPQCIDLLAQSHIPPIQNIMDVNHTSLFNLQNQ